MLQWYLPLCSTHCIFNTKSCLSEEHGNAGVCCDVMIISHESPPAWLPFPSLFNCLCCIVHSGDEGDWERSVRYIPSYRSLPFRLVKSISSTPNANLSWIKHFGGMNTFNDGWASSTEMQLFRMWICLALKCNPSNNLAPCKLDSAKFE